MNSGDANLVERRPPQGLAESDATEYRRPPSRGRHNQIPGSWRPS
jgi:hypothetical protein